jgi:hypothetical protein
VVGLEQARASIGVSVAGLAEAGSPSDGHGEFKEEPTDDAAMNRIGLNRHRREVIDKTVTSLAPDRRLERLRTSRRSAQCSEARRWHRPDEPSASVVKQAGVVERETIAAMPAKVP